MAEVETLARTLWVRVMQDSAGKMLPSEAARLVAGILGVSPVAVLLSVAGRVAHQPR